jgi:hypothetical protein
MGLPDVEKWINSKLKEDVDQNELPLRKLKFYFEAFGTCGVEVEASDD